MSRQLKEYDVQYTFQVAQQASEAVTEFLLTTFPQTVAVHNVEAEPAYQEHDIDLLWTVQTREGGLRVFLVEVKGDRYHRTGNFFFETVSNEQKQTPGCFLYTKADYLFYYFVEIGRLYSLPLAQVRPWFMAHSDRFAERRTSTPAGISHYITIGRLVPIAVALAENAGIRQYQRQDTGQWSEVPT